VEKLEYHVFKKPKKLKNGKSVRRWYYYYLDESGKQIQKSCGENIKNRQAAEDFIRTLPPPPRNTAPTLPGGIYTMPRGSADITVAELAGKMFIPGSDHIRRRQQLNKSTTPETLTANRRFMIHITKTWGDRPLRSLEMDEVMGYLFAVTRSASWKNQYISNLNEIYQEAQFLGCKIFKPDFPTIGKVPNKADVFTKDELNRFFKKENFTHDFFYLFFLTSLSGGLRLGETRGLRAKQIIFDKKAVIVDGYLKSNSERTTYNKKGTPEHPKLRVVPYPDYTLDLLKKHIDNNSIGADDYIFTYSGHPISKTMAETAFTNALIKSGIAYNKQTLIDNKLWKGGHAHKTRGIIPGGRRLIHHSFRYTYITNMRTEVDAHNLSKLTGHESTAQVDYYNRRNLELALQSIPNATLATNALITTAIKKTS